MPESEPAVADALIALATASDDLSVARRALGQSARHARQLGATYTDIGPTLGITRQAA